MRSLLFFATILTLSIAMPAHAEVRITEQADGITVVEINGPSVPEGTAVSTPAAAAPMSATAPAIPATYEGEPFARIEFLTKEIGRIEREREAIRLGSGAKTPQETERDRIALIRKTQEMNRNRAELIRLKAKLQGPGK
ncbi:MAG: hypothetical protein WAV26_00930 [Candidatus Deferrimicrobium sp.]